MNGAITNYNRAVVALLHQVPIQPLYNRLYEDALISYTLNEFKRDGYNLSNIKYQKPVLKYHIS